MIRLKKLLLEPVVILLPDPLNVTVPAVGVKPPLFPLSSQLPAISILVPLGSNTPAVKVKTPSISKFVEPVLVPDAFISKLKNLLSDFVVIVELAPLKIIFPAAGAKPAFPLPLSSQLPAISCTPA